MLLQRCANVTSGTGSDYYFRNLNTEKVETKRNISIQGKYPDPENRLEEQWDRISKLLDKQMPVSKSNMFASIGKRAVYYTTGLVLIAAVVISVKQYFASWEPLTNIYKSGSGVQTVHISDSALLYMDHFSTVSETSEQGNKKFNIIQGAAFFKNTARQGHCLWQLKAGSVIAYPFQADLYMHYDSAARQTDLYVSEGIVAVDLTGRRMLLGKGESFRYDDQYNKISRRDSISLNQFGFATFIFEFNDSPLTEVLETLGKTYGYYIVPESEEIKSCRLTSRFDNKSLKEILRIIEYILDVEFVIDESGKRVLIRGNGCS